MAPTELRARWWTGVDSVFTLALLLARATGAARRAARAKYRILAASSHRSEAKLLEMYT